MVIEVSLPSNLKGITLFPFILVENKRDRVLVNHELIHYQQAKELLVIGFYLFYIGQYLYFRLKGKSAKNAYRHLSLEIEAYNNEKDLNYLKTRKKYAFFRPNR
jgi:hypothetical protein